MSYVTLDMQIIHPFTIRLVRSTALSRWHVQYGIFKDKLQLKASYGLLGNIIFQI